MRILLAPDSFKESLSSKEISQILKACALKVFGEDTTVDIFEAADGGEGTLTAVSNFMPLELKKVTVKNALFEDTKSEYGISGETAVIEMSKASGLEMIPANRRNPYISTTYGTGQLIKAALLSGCKHIIIAIGGSATNDAGIGAAAALGAVFKDRNKNVVAPNASSLAQISEIDTENMLPEILEAKFTVMCDVKNPLTGKNGATYTFGAQKGADQNMLELLEKGMINYKTVLTEKFGTDPDTVYGAGAAGGLGAALNLFLKAEMKSGIDTLLDMYGFDEKLQNADLVISGEGRVDWQSAQGKVISGIAKRCTKYNKPLIVIAGSIGKNAYSLFDSGVTAIFSIVDKPMTLDESIKNTPLLLSNTAENIFRLIKNRI